MSLAACSSSPDSNGAPNSAGAGSGATSGTGGTASGGKDSGGTGASTATGASNTGGGTGGIIDTGARKTQSLGIGLNGIADWSTEFPFLDLMKQSRWWGPNDPTFALDEQGWVKTVAAGQEVILVFLTVGDVPAPSTRWVVKWEGDGTPECVWGSTLVTHADHRDIIDTTGGQGALKLPMTAGSNYLRNIRIVAESQEKLLDAGQLFNPIWLEKLKDFRAVRFMDWMGTNGSKQKDWVERPKADDATYMSKGAPVEVMVRLANELNADPWFNMPHLGTEDYVTQFATYVKGNLSPKLRAYVEYSNEVWNFGFEQAQYAVQQAKTVLGQDGGTGWVQFNGMKAAQTCDIWKKTVYGSEASRVHCVLGAFTGWRDTITDTLECPKWVEKGNEPCYKHGIDSIAMTGYFSGCLAADENVDTIRGWFSDADKGLQKAAEQVLDGRHIKCTDTAKGNAETFAFFKAEADKRGLAITAYEGGQHITGNGHAIQDDAGFIALHTGVNNHPMMKDVYMTNLNGWKDAGGTLFMHFVDIGNPGKYGSWGALEYLTQEASPKWEALSEFTQQKCWWTGCDK